jgi:hypothetical protein
VIRRNRNLIVRLLTLAFLFAQFGMLAHASKHLNTDAHGVPAAQLCGECLCSGALQNLAGGAAPVLFAVHVSHDAAIGARADQSVRAHAFTAFRSRAPPILL